MAGLSDYSMTDIAGGKKPDDDSMADYSMASLGGDDDSMADPN